MPDIRTPSPKLSVLRTRREFLQMRDGNDKATSGLILIAREHPQNGAAMRFGLTVSKKCGNAVRRNRIKRRLRALVKEMLPQYGAAGFDYVVIGRASTATRSFDDLRDDLRRALAHFAQQPTQNITHA